MMMTAKPISEIYWPGPALSRCLFCAIVRDTRKVALNETQRLNFFPASPLCYVSWVLEGDYHLISCLDEMERPWTS